MRLREQDTAREFKEVNRDFERLSKNLQALKVAQVMLLLTTGIDKLNDAAKQLVIIKQQNSPDFSKTLALYKPCTYLLT